MSLRELAVLDDGRYAAAELSDWTNCGISIQSAPRAPHHSLPGRRARLSTVTPSPI
jgi:hypothetical protein